MDVYVNFPIEDKVKSIAERVLFGCDIYWYPEYYDTEVQIIKNKYIVGKNTKMIQTVSAGVDHLDIARIPDSVILCSNAGAYSISVAEHTFALILSHAKNIIENNYDMKRGVFKQSSTTLLYGKTLGILGYGGIGRRVASIAKAYDMKVIAYSRSGIDENVDETTSTASELFEKSDIVVLSIPLTDKTRGMVNIGLLSGLKKGTMIVNVARPDVVVKQDMIRFLRSNPSIWYMSDVWWNEPDLKDTNLDNVILSPHVAGGMSGEIMDIAYEFAFRNVMEYFRGNAKNVVKKDDYKLSSSAKESFPGIP
ncbi:MAG: 2-hydroxyacid dehydrogenase [Thermoplasmatales archaeon]|nr:2-hydroxyacid dehydrogenase [Thermoplasmatales archaeon]MCW6170335.1 2-hydroxyacid dehydrogenase [Thermoplasmatales archaeon]